jgi:diguanylate cyclase (GGDEF)-like protein/PAS domain S-box-containing protein
MAVRRRPTGARLEVLFLDSALPMLVVDPDGAVLEANEAAVAEYGWSADEFRTLRLDELIVHGGPVVGEVRHRRRDGSTRWVSPVTTPAVHGGRPALLCVLHDVGRRHELDLRSRAIVDNVADAILTVDDHGCIESLNPAAERLFGCVAAEVIGTPVDRLLPPEDTALTSAGATLDLRLGVVLGHEVLARKADGTRFPLELSVTDVDLGDRAISTIVARDVTERRAYERRLTHLGTHDALTGLPNRVLFMDRLHHGLATAARTRRPTAVLFCDLDRFKVVNDSLGHTAGDALLVNVARRFRSAVRESDTVARFGGDEFVVLAEELTDAAHAVVVADKLASTLAEPILLGTQEIHMSASIGIAVADGSATPETLVRDADAAMYRAKATGRSRHVVFDADLRRQALQRLDTESALRRGTGLREFVVHYQPEVDLTTGGVVGLEALVRWDHPDEGLTMPAAFLPVAEETGIIVTIGEQVLEQVCAHAARWRARLGRRTPTVWVNLSARQLASPALPDVLGASMAAHGLDSGAIGLEITETDIVPDDERSALTMRRLTELGHPIAIDDFGTGFASLSYLWRFPASVIKIDQAFVQRLDEGREAAALIEAMIQMAHSLGKTTVAEGVETDAHLALLRELGCDTVQGYLLGRPGPAPEVDLLFA